MGEEVVSLDKIRIPRAIRVMADQAKMIAELEAELKAAKELSQVWADSLNSAREIHSVTATENECLRTALAEKDDWIETHTLDCLCRHSKWQDLCHSYHDDDCGWLKARRAGHET